MSHDDTLASLPKPKWVKVSPEASFEQVVVMLGQTEQAGLAVVDLDKIVQGVILAKDLPKLLLDKKHRSDCASDLMRPSPLCFDEDTNIKEALTRMAQHGLEFAPVLKRGRYSGVVLWRQLAQLVLDEDEQMIKQSEVLDEKFAMHSEYFAILAHDVRVPLSVVLLCAEDLKNEKKSGALTQSQVAYVDRILGNASVAKEMVIDLLRALKAEKQSPLKMESVDVESFLSKVVSDLQLIADQKKITLDTSSDVGVLAYFDKRRMQYVLENLVSNAVGVSPEGGRVMLAARLMDRGQKNYLSIEVSDEGPGIPKQEVGSLFDKFVQGSSNMKSHIGTGFGLGLAIVKKYVQLHNGMVEVEGGWQSGATFRVLIPLSCNIENFTSNTPVSDPIAPSGAKDHASQVLIVEDDDAIREYFEAELQEKEYRVITATNGQDGLSMYLRHRPDIVLTDIRMPVMDGLELLARIRASDNETPVILCTGYYPGLANDLTGSLHRANCVLEKPVAIDRVIEAIEACMASKKHINAS